MKENKIRYIVIIMTAAVVGLIGTQIYWMSNIISIEKEKFDRTAQEALQRVTLKLEKQETVKSVLKKITPGRSNLVMIVNDDHAGIIKKNPDSSKSQKLFRVEISNNDTNKLNYSIKRDGSFSGDRLYFSTSKPMDSGNFIWQYKMDSVKVKRSKLVQDVVTELIEVTEKKNLKDRINENTLDKYISEELINSGIATDFYFGVIGSKNDSLIIQKEGSEKTELANSNIRALLFPDEIFSRPNELVVYFPNQFGFILKTVSGMLALSIVLILVIVAVFQRTLRMLISQKKLTQLKNDLINNITHEFKTPISTISLACEALNEPELAKDTGSVNRYSGIIKEENERLRTMVETLLNTAALEKGKIHFIKEDCNLHEIIIEITGIYSQTVANLNGSFDLRLNAGNFIVQGDKFHMKNIFRNLIDNAIKYNENPPRITIETGNIENMISAKVSDNGIGIDRQNIDRVFDNFFRVQTGNVQNVRGNGIGLSYVKQIIESFGGSINLTSTPRNGSTFEVLLPLAGEGGGNEN